MMDVRNDERSSLIPHNSSLFLLEVTVSSLCETVHGLLHSHSCGVDVLIATNDDRLSVQERRACERNGHDHAIPGTEELFFFAVKAKGTIGRLVAWAA